MHRLFHRRAQDSVTRAIECPREICSIGSIVALYGISIWTLDTAQTNFCGRYEIYALL